jgi:hypothetical protein
MVTQRQIVAGSIVTGLGRLAGQQPVSAVHLQDDQPTFLMGDAAALRGQSVARIALTPSLGKCGAFDVAALVRGAGYRDGDIGEASLEYMKALKVEVGV